MNYFAVSCRAIVVGIGGLVLSSASFAAGNSTVIEDNFSRAFVELLSQTTQVSSGISSALLSGAMALLGFGIGVKLLQAFLIGMLDNDLVDGVREFFTAIILGVILSVTITNWSSVRATVEVANKELVSVVGSVVGVPYDTASPASMAQTAKGLGSSIGAIYHNGACALWGGGKDSQCPPRAENVSESLMQSVLAGLGAMVLWVAAMILTGITVVIVCSYLLIGHFTLNAAMAFGIVLVACYPLVPMWAYNTLSVVAGAILYQAVALMSIGVLVKISESLIDPQIAAMGRMEGLLPTMTGLAIMSGLLLLALPTLQGVAMALVGGASIDFGRMPPGGKSPPAKADKSSETSKPESKGAEVAGIGAGGGGGGGLPALPAPNSSGNGVMPMSSSKAVDMPGGGGGGGSTFGGSSAGVGATGTSSASSASASSGMSEAARGASVASQMVGAASTQAEFDKARRQFDQRHHPDKGGSEEAHKAGRAAIKSIAASKGFRMR